MQLLHEFRYSTRRFLLRIAVFACLGTAILFLFGSSAPGGSGFSMRELAVPVGFLAVVLTAAGVYNARHHADFRLRLYDEGMQSGQRFIAWSHVTDMRFEDYGIDAQSFHLEVSLTDGSKASHDLNWLTRSPREVYRCAVTAWQSATIAAEADNPKPDLPPRQAVTPAPYKSPAGR